ISAGPIAYGICQTPQGCNAVVVACYGAAGFTFGTVTAGWAFQPLLCSAACATVALFAPTP
ncbi:hypothetical protein CPB85DRAFT_1311570, partial [Mucidula mucida]